MNVMDSFPGENHHRQDVIGIAKIMMGKTVVGWIYRVQSNRYYAQAMPNMPAYDQRIAEFRPVHYDPKFHRSLENETPRLYSGLVPISRWPWRDLSLNPCVGGDSRSH